MITGQGGHTHFREWRLQMELLLMRAEEIANVTEVFARVTLVTPLGVLGDLESATLSSYFLNE